MAQRLGHVDLGFTMRVHGHVRVHQQQAPAAQRGAALLGEESFNTGSAAHILPTQTLKSDICAIGFSLERPVNCQKHEILRLSVYP